MRKPVLVVVALLACLASQGAVGAQQRGAASASLSAIDYFEIENLYARYHHGLDSGADNGFMYADVFTPDGVYVDIGGRSIQGRDALAEFAKGGANAKKGPTTVATFVTDVVIDPSPTGASGRGFVMVGRPADTASNTRAAIVGGGQYWDDLVRTPAGWRIQKRTFVRPGSAGVPSTATAPQAPRAGVVSTSMTAAPASGAIKLTADDYAQIYHLYGRYGYAFDGGVDEGRMWAQMFTEDGFHVNHSANEYVKGHDALAEFARGATRYERGFTVYNKNMKGTTKDERRIGHIITNVMLTPVADGVVVKAYRMTGSIGADGAASITPGGIYFDYLVKTTQGWRYKEKFYIGSGAAVPELAKKYITIPAVVKPEFTQTAAR